MITTAEDFFRERDRLIQVENRRWYERMCANRSNMGLPPAEYDPKHNYIPVNVKRDMFGTPSRG